MTGMNRLELNGMKKNKQTRTLPKYVLATVVHFLPEISFEDMLIKVAGNIYFEKRCLRQKCTKYQNSVAEIKDITHQDSGLLLTNYQHELGQTSLIELASATRLDPRPPPKKKKKKKKKKRQEKKTEKTKNKPKTNNKQTNQQ